MKHQLGLNCLGFYEEAVGTLHGIAVDQGFLIAQVSKVSVALPIEMENKLVHLIGTRIGILRTDIPGKEYLFRMIEGEKSTTTMKIQNDCWNARAAESCEASA